MNIGDMWNGFVEFGQGLVSTTIMNISGVTIKDGTSGVIFFGLLAAIVLAYLANSKRRVTKF